MTTLLDRVNPPSNAVTEGASPKVTLPALVLLAAAVLLIAAGVITSDQNLLAGGIAILAAAAPATAVGVAAGPGSIVVGAPNIDQPSDHVLSDEAAAEIASTQPPA